jgi:hypothetical protein
VTGLGANAAGATVTAGQGNTNQQSNLLTGMGSVGAAGTIGAAAAQNQGLRGNRAERRQPSSDVLLRAVVERSGGGGAPAASPGGGIRGLRRSMLASYGLGSING